jgi:ATP-dependent helicase IRC3
MQAFNTFARDAHLAAPLSTLGLIRISQHDAGWTEVTEEHHVVFSSIQSAVLERSAGSITLLVQESPCGLFIVVDEAHHAAAPSYLRLLKQLKADQAQVLGLTATPTRTDDADNTRLWDIFDKTMIYEINKRELIHREILAQPHVLIVQTRIDIEKNFTSEDYQYLERYGELAPKVLDELAKHAARNKLIVDYYRDNAAKYGKTIVFAATAAHARTLAEEFQKASIKADYVDYTRGDSTDVMEKFRDNPDPVVLANVEMCAEGFDAPRTKTIFIARPTRSEALLAQMIGRALRGPKVGGNPEAYLVTFVDTWKEFSVLDTEAG